MNLIKKLFRCEIRTEEKVTTSTLETPVSTNLAVKLRSAEQRYNAATSKKELLLKQIAAAEGGIVALEATLRSHEVKFRETKNQELINTRHKVERLRSAIPAVESELDTAERELIDVRCEVVKNPDYIAALKEHVKLVLEAHEIAKGAWRTPLGDVPPLIKRYDAVVDREVHFVLATNVRFSRLGLPEIREQISGSSLALPLFVNDFPFDILARDAHDALERLASIARRWQGLILKS
jgi:hypothetical protein